MSTPSWLAPFIGHSVIADLDGSYLVLGRLDAADDAALSFSEADLHDHAEANCTKEVYAIESQKLGVRVNRRRVVIPRARVIALSLLEDVSP